jgi:rhodanese-related sulfurtransferase
VKGVGEENVIDWLRHLPTALDIPLSQEERRLGELRCTKVVAYCRGPWCALSFEAVALVCARGYRVRRLEDGFPEWGRAAGLPTVKKLEIDNLALQELGGINTLKNNAILMQISDADCVRHLWLCEASQPRRET